MNIAHLRPINISQSEEEYIRDSWRRFDPNAFYLDDYRLVVNNRRSDIGLFYSTSGRSRSDLYLCGFSFIDGRPTPTRLLCEINHWVLHSRSAYISILPHARVYAVTKMLKRAGGNASG